jgi:replication fork protection complex subunit Tof1/Swi1
LELFKTILADERSLPKDKPYKDLISLINFILRQFFKALAEDPFLAVEVWIHAVFQSLTHIVSNSIV